MKFQTKIPLKPRKPGSLKKLSKADFSRVCLCVCVCLCLCGQESGFEEGETEKSFTSNRDADTSYIKSNTRIVGYLMQLSSRSGRG